MAVHSPDRKLALFMESLHRGRIVSLRGGMLSALDFPGRMQFMKRLGAQHG